MIMTTNRLTIVTLIVLLPLLLCGCLTLDTAVTFEEDGSGSLELDYTISSMVMNLGSMGEDDLFVPLPVTEEDFTAAAALIEGLTLDNFEFREDEQGVHVNALLRFRNPVALSQFLFPGETGKLTIEQANGDVRFSYLVFTPPDEPVSERSMEMIRTFFADDTLSFAVTAPSPVTDAGAGTIGGNNRSAVLELSVAELYERNEEIIWEIRW